MLSLKNVSVLEKKTNQAIVNNVSIEVRAGDFLVVGGQNDVERELLVSLIGTMDLASKGEVYVEGIELTKYTPVQIVSLRREKFGFMLNNCELDENLSVGENIELPLVFAGVHGERKRALLERALSIVGLSSFCSVLVKNLTEWQKNKVMIARAIVNQPKVLIISEPCRVLEKSRMEEVLGLLTALNQDGVTIVVNSNQPEFNRIAKRRVVITNGTIVEFKKEKIKDETKSKPRKTKSIKSKKSTSKAVKEKVAEKVEEVEQAPVVDVAETVEKPKKKRVTKEKGEATADEVVAVETEKKQTTKGRTKKQGVEDNAVNN